MHTDTVEHITLLSNLISDAILFNNILMQKPFYNLIKRNFKLSFTDNYGFLLHP